MNKRNVTNILLAIIIFLLLVILFQGKIKSYLKAQEVLKRANVFNISYVAMKCDKYIKDDSESDIPNDCQNEITNYQDKIQKWQSLIKQYRDINCKDFVNSLEANEFYSYVSGEVAKLFYGGAFDGHCHYDPYGLDTNGDCKACESYE